MLFHPLLPLFIPHEPPVRPHAEPETAPVLRAGAHPAVAVQVVELAPEGLAVEGGVEGGAAGDCGGVDCARGYCSGVGGRGRG